LEEIVDVLHAQLELHLMQIKEIVSLKLLPVETGHVVN
jgi:hypothetical protein